MINKHSDTLFKASLQEVFFTSPDTYIHPTAHVDPSVKLGSGVKIGPHCVITGNVIIGDRTMIHAYVALGFPAQVVGITKSLGTIKIGSDCQIREFATIHASRYEHGQTTIGNNCYIMNHAHVGHDATLEDHVTLINNVMLAGHTYVEHHAIIMASSATHQFSRIGAYTALAPYSGIRQDLPPYGIYTGKPARFSGLNLIGLRRAGFSVASIQALKRATTLFYRDKLLLAPLKEALAADSLTAHDSLVEDFITFIENSSRGVSRALVHDAHDSHQQEAS